MEKFTRISILLINKIQIPSEHDPIPVGILYRNPDAPCYEDRQVPDKMNTAEGVMSYLETEFDKFTIKPGGTDE